NDDSQQMIVRATMVTGAIAGVVKDGYVAPPLGGVGDAHGDPLRGVKVALFQNGVQVGADATTDVDGNYSFSGLLPGWYDVRAWLTDNEAKPPLLEMHWYQNPITKSEVWVQRNSPTSRVAAQSHQDVLFSAFAPWFTAQDTNLSA